MVRSGNNNPDPSPINGTSRADSSKKFWLLPYKRILLTVIFVQTVTSQTVPWLIDTIVSSNLSTTTTPNYVDTATQGTTNLYLSTGLPVFDGELITNGLYYDSRVFDNVRVHAPNGTSVLNFSTGRTGGSVVAIKAVGTSMSAITCTYSTIVTAQKKFVLVQPISALGGLLATAGSPITTISTLVSLIQDQPGTIYFYGAGDRMYRFSSVDGSLIAQTSTALGSGAYYTEFIFEIPALNAILMYTSSNNRTGLFNKLDLSISQSKTLPEGMNDLAIQSRSDRTVLWNVFCPDGFNNVLEKRVITNNAALMTTVGSSANMHFYLGALAQISTMNIIMVSPYHNDFWTPADSRGAVFFVREDTLAITRYSTPQYWLLMRMSREFANPLSEDDGRRFYLLFADSETQNVHSYYFLADTCMSIDGNTLTCSDCPIGYWRASASFPAPRRCVSPSNFPSRTGMVNNTMTFESCSVAQCTDCTFDSSKCTGCDTANGYFLRETASGGVCELKSELPPRYGVDGTGKKGVPCADSHCIDCLDRFDLCTKCDTAQEYFRSSNSCIAKSELEQGQGVNMNLGTVEKCTANGCINCFDSFTSCQQCDANKYWYLDTGSNSCVSRNNFTPDQGADLATGIVTKCQDIYCSNCKANFKECSK